MAFMGHGNEGGSIKAIRPSLSIKSYLASKLVLTFVSFPSVWGWVSVAGWSRQQPLIWRIRVRFTEFIRSVSRFVRAGLWWWAVVVTDTASDADPASSHSVWVWAACELPERAMFRHWQLWLRRQSRSFTNRKAGGSIPGSSSRCPWSRHWTHTCPPVCPLGVWMWMVSFLHCA